MNCFSCGSSSFSNKSIFSEISEIPQGLDRGKSRAVLISICNLCQSVSCREISGDAINYEKSICFEASSKTFKASQKYDPYSSALINSRLKKLLKQKRVVDFGAGAGFYTKLLTKYSSSVIGVDLDPLAVESLRASNIVAIKGGMEIFSTLTYDIVSMVGVLEHFENPFELISEASKFLPHDGLLVLYYPNIHSLSRLLAIKSNHEWDMFLEPGHLSFPSNTSMKRRMSELGYELVDFWTTSNISRGKNPFASVRNDRFENMVRVMIDGSSVLRGIYKIIYKALDLMRRGDINCYVFRKGQK